MAVHHLQVAIAPTGAWRPPGREWGHAGAAAGADAEVLLEHRDLGGQVEVDVHTPVADDPALWPRLLADWAAAAGAGDVQIVIYDNSAAPATISRRLWEAWDQALGADEGSDPPAGSSRSTSSWTALQDGSFWSATARDRAQGLCDPGTFRELLGPQHRLTSPHLPQMGFPTQLDDGVVTGVGRIGRRLLFVVSMDGRYVGGSLGEVNGAKMVGTLQLALREYRRGFDGQHLPPDGPAVAVVFETGGVRLQEANSGLLACAELMDACHELRDRVPTVALVGGRIGSFGGLGFVTDGTDALIMGEFGRLGLTGPEVVEEEMGKDEFDAGDRSLVWRTTGGRHRYLVGDANFLVADGIGAFRRQLQAVLALSGPELCALRRIGTSALVMRELALAQRAAAAGVADSRDLWRLLGYTDPEGLPDLPLDDFRAAVDRRLHDRG